MLKVSALRKSFETIDGAHRALQQVDFEVASGEFFALLGSSGCGKTTTLRCVAGLERPDAGTIGIRDTVVTDPARGVHVPAHDRDIGMVFQSYAIWPHLNVFDNVGYPLQVQRDRPSRAEIARRVNEVLAQVGMADLARRAATALSGGQQQRVALARALVRRPSLLLLDEPLSNLDAQLREQMQHELADLVERVAITTLYVTHDQGEAMALADRVAVMRDGQIVQVGAPDELYEHPRTSFVATFLGRANFLSGKMVAIEGGAGSIALDSDGGRLRLPLPNGGAQGARYDVVVRPEDVACSGTPPGREENVLIGEVDRVSFQGSHSECFVKVAGTVIRAHLQPASVVRAGDRVWLIVNPVRCSLFPAT